MIMKPKINLILSITCTLYFIVAFVSVPTANASNILPPPTKISQHVYAWIGPLEGPNEKNQGFRMNMAFVVGQNAVAVIDTGYTAEMAMEMITHIRRYTKLPIKYAINTNSQPHRYMGNDVFRHNGAEIIAHANSANRMQEMGNLFSRAIENSLKKTPSDVKLPKQPNHIISSDMTFDLGGLPIEVQYMGAAHTPAQLIVKVPQDKLIVTGDLLYSGRLLAILRDSNIENWLLSFEKLKQFGDVLFIPGHGQPGKLDDFEMPTKSYLVLIDKHMRSAIESMTDLQDAINTLDQDAFKHLVNFEQLSGSNASWAYLFYENNSM